MTEVRFELDFGDRNLPLRDHRVAGARGEKDGKKETKKSSEQHSCLQSFVPTLCRHSTYYNSTISKISQFLIPVFAEFFNLF